MPLDASGLLLLILQLLQQFSEWLKIAPREPTWARDVVTVGVPAVTAAIAVLVGVVIGNRHQAGLRERDEIAEAWDGPLANLRAAVDAAGWPSRSRRRGVWLTYEGRWNKVEPAEKTFYASRSHRLNKFITPDTHAVEAWLDAERHHRMEWASASANRPLHERAALALLLDGEGMWPGDVLTSTKIEGR